MIIDATLGAKVSQAPISFTGSGDNTVVSGVSGSIIRVLQLFLVLSGNSTLIFKSGSTALSGTMSMLANGSIVLDYIQLPLTCNVNDSFVISTGSNIVVGGTIWYILQ